MGGTPGGCLKESCNRHSHGKKDFDIRTRKSNRQAYRDDREWHMKYRVSKNMKICLNGEVVAPSEQGTRVVT